ncbi:uncharacterized protein I303_106162 [Kwoniella dejecticola CBS 10117]|uniref:Uncharacterized protein n=1 Tax=Kwoniella dejecticola CBS 10117 TaxID=1296121 RepID=A0A1A6A1H7_9TREE|nr:uncharacterized protein I303_06180 [Kwoniella dejecticola CBS 10117]OBR83895.1 hypothetical protein I303_06180 [Kwoniella dejecticola CBS 10117]
MSTTIASSSDVNPPQSPVDSQPGPLPTPPSIHDQTVSPSTSAEPSIVRRPTLQFPALHLGSFDTLSISGTPPLPPTQHLSSSSSHSRTNSSSRPDFGVKGKAKAVDVDPSASSGVQARDETSQSLSAEPTRSSSHSSRSSSHRLHKGSIPPPLPPPTMALPPLPTLSPISPIKPPSPSYLQSTMFQPRSSSSSSSSLGQQLPGEGRRELPTVPARGRTLGHSLTIHVPGPLTPSPSDQEGNPIPSPILKHSPGVARRRTVVENSNVNLGSPVRVSGFTGNMTPPRDSDSSPTRNADNKSPPIERGSILMPQPRPSPAIEQKSTFDITPRPLEKKRSSADLKNTSPTSPTTKRSLPRPPKIDTSLAAKPSTSDLSTNIPASTSLLQTALPTNIATAAHTDPLQAPAIRTQPTQIPGDAQANLALPVTAPVPSSSWPPLNINLSPTTAKAPPLLSQPEPTPKQTVYQKHQANKSASSLPVVAGLADAGPFAGAFTRPIQAGAGPTANGLGLGRPSNQVANGQIRGPSGKPQEEVCLECMMRDRDLADVIVQGEGIWERESDGDWRDLEWREVALLKSLGAQEDHAVYKQLFRAADESIEDSDSTSFSPPSTGNSVEDAQLRRELDARRKRRSLLRAKKREADRRVAVEVGWRGHKWEEGDAGEGLPRGFRGTKGGKLTEEGIKGVMTKFPSASAHRYQTLQGYLRQQWHLVQEVRAEAQRLGRFPFPDEIVTSSSTVSSHEGALMPRSTQSNTAIQNQPYGREGVYTPVRGTPTLSVVRPSPSSPANLTALANPPRAAPLQRPLTHFLPDREPSLGAPRTPIYASPISASTRGRHGKQGSSPGLLERSPPPGTYDESNEELWSPADEPGAGLRPFSFAVRAGAGAAAGSDGHGGRRSLWGRFGGSVTSLFGGSQNGSGSMMDMHLGLDNDRRSRASSYNVNPYPRAVSMASPTRPSFFSRDSRCSSDINVNEMPRMSRAISHSRLSQMRLDDEGDEADEKPKKKGIKGFFKKMKPKTSKSKSRSNLSARSEDQYRGERTEQPLPDTPLAPPPPISYLVGGNRKHTRDRSGSSSSMLTDGQDSVQGGKRYSASLPYGMRSVSAPMNGTASSSGGSLSASPTSSKFATSGPGKRESYASGRRRTSFGVNEMGEQQQPFGILEQDRAHSGMEMLSNNVNRGMGIYSTSPDAIYDEPSSMYRSNNMGYPSANFTGANNRPHNKTTSSLSNSSGTMAIETPPPAICNPSAFFNQQQQQIHLSQTASHGAGEKHGSMTRSQSGQLSPNRFKNLPPLPPSDPNGNIAMAASPDSFAAAFPDQEVNLTGSNDPKYLASSGGYLPHVSSAKIDFSASNPVGSPNSVGYNQHPHQYNGNGYPQPPQLYVNTQNLGSAHPPRAMTGGRASFDQPSPRARVGAGPNARAVKTMYGQPMAEDMGSAPTYGMGVGMGKDVETRKKKGLKGFFGSNKAGRMA